MRVALGRDSENWRVQNACPPCTHKVCFTLIKFVYRLTVHRLENKPLMMHGRKAAFNSNNSMKRLYQLGERNIQDPCPFLDTDYLLTPEYVDQFKDEVGNSSKAPNVGMDEADNVGARPQPTEGFAKQRAECTNNFKSVHQEGKTMWGFLKRPAGL